MSDRGWSECHSGLHAGSRKQRLALVGSGCMSVTSMSLFLLPSELTCMYWHEMGKPQQLSEPPLQRLWVCTDRCEPRTGECTWTSAHHWTAAREGQHCTPEAGMDQRSPNQEKNTLQFLKKLDQATPGQGWNWPLSSGTCGNVYPAAGERPTLLR